MVKVDVIVIGSGLTGLVAARRLQERGFVVAVLEAQDVVGGRIRAIEDNAGRRHELGAQWIHPDHSRMLALIQEMGRETIPMSLHGEITLKLGGRSRQTKELLSYWGALPHEIADAKLAVRTLNRRAEYVHLQEPWKSVDAHKFDMESFGDWIHRNTRTAWARDFLRTAFQVAIGANVDEVSALHLIFLIASAGSSERFLAGALGHDRLVIPDGFHALVEDLAWEMRERVLLKEKVVLVENSAHDVGLRTETSRYRARRVVVALPPSAWTSIVFDPALPEDWDLLGTNAVEGASWRFVLRFASPFWRETGHSGEVLSSSGVLSFVTDCSDPKSKDGSLVAVATGKQARKLRALSPVARKQAVLKELASTFGERVRNVVHFAERDWTGGEQSGSCHLSLMAAHAWRRHGEAMRTRWGRIHFAGAEMSTSWAGFMEGAVHSGEEVAQLIARIERPNGTKITFEE